ncbi:MAG: LysR family transcriptional regulator [Sphingomonas bacterium]|jgi:DNA-binding transcriptional LysR family regulator|nr:LysR family transcriptional regulator [Sphingomonas bacterium]
MIDRYHLRYFLAVIDQGNFSKAAAFCNVSQPTLSVGIAKLEAMIGQPLFVRTNRRVELTGAGADLVSHARRIEAEFGLAERGPAGAGKIATIRLGVLATTPWQWIETFLQRQLAFPGDERVEIVEGRERDLLEGLTRGRIDVALTIVRDNARFESETLFSEGYALAMASGHRLADRAVIAADELIHEPMIVRRQCELLSETSRHFTARGVRPFFPARTTSEVRALSYVRAGLGVTVMPDCFTDAGIVRPRLRDFAFTREVGLLYARHADPARLRDGPSIRVLIDVIEQARHQSGGGN